jgi:hypothetical protein
MVINGVQANNIGWEPVENHKNSYVITSISSPCYQ